MEGSGNPLEGSLVSVLVVEDAGELVVLIHKGKRRLPELKPLLKIFGKTAAATGVYRWASPQIEDKYQREFVARKTVEAIRRWTEGDWKDLLSRGEGYYSMHGRRYYSEPIYAGWQLHSSPNPPS